MYDLKQPEQRLTFKFYSWSKVILSNNYSSIMFTYFFVLFTWFGLVFSQSARQLSYLKGDFTFNISYNEGSHVLFGNDFTEEQLGWDYNNTNCTLGGYIYYPVGTTSRLALSVIFTEESFVKFFNLK